MKAKTDALIIELLPLMQSCHSVLGTAWPRPNFPQLAGAKTFIGTNLFSSLENGAERLNEQFSQLKVNGFDRDLLLLWNCCNETIAQLKQMGRASTNPNIDSAFNLLYFAIGVLYQEMAHKLPALPIQDSRFSTVPSIDKLAELCQWRGGTNEIATQIAKSLSAVLNNNSSRDNAYDLPKDSLSNPLSVTAELCFEEEWNLAPAGTASPLRYWSHVHFDGDLNWGKEIWTLLIELDKPPQKSQRVFKVKVFFLSPNAPINFLKQGQQFNLCVGSIIKCRGIID